MSTAVELSAVTKNFGPKRAVDGLDLTVPEGSIYGFIGPNGSGKTTTLRLILRIFQPDAGKVVVLGTDRGSVADDRLGYLPEERGLYKRMKVGEVIAFFARLKGFYDCRGAVTDWLERLGAGDWADKRLDTLSKGMTQKIQFITAVIARPRLLILDEPFSGLDPVNLEVLREAIFALREQGTTIIFSTHDMHIAEEMCDTIFMIFEGRKVLDGTLSEIQQKYPVNRVRLRLCGGGEPPDAFPGVTVTPEQSGFHALTLADGLQPQAVLRQIAATCDIEHFEQVRPTLHDIFVEIAGPRAGGSE